jgi:hypothetical protein
MRAELAQVRAAIDPASDVANVSPVAMASPPTGAHVVSGARRTRSRAAIAVGALLVVVAASLLLVYRDGRVATDAGSGSTPSTALPAAATNEPTVAVEKPAPAQPQDGVGRQSARGDRAAAPDQPGKKSVDVAPPKAVAAAPQRTAPPVEPRADVPRDLPTISASATPPPAVTEPPPAPTPPAAAAAPAATPAPPPPEAPTDSAAIMKILRGYDAAYRSLDVGAVLRVFPSLGAEQQEQLRRTFAGVTAYEMETRVTRVDVKNESATVLANVVRRMTPRIGDRRPIANDVPTEFHLRRSGSEWVIVSVMAR